MQSAQFLVWLLLLVSGCQAVRAEEPQGALFRRTGGSRSPSPSRSKGKAPLGEGHSTGTGLLEDIVHQAMRRPAPAAHGSHPTHAHAMHLGQATHSLAAAQTDHTPHSMHPMHGKSSDATNKEPGDLRHLVAGLQPGPKPRPPKARGRPRKDPSEALKPKRPSNGIEKSPGGPAGHGAQAPRLRGSGRHETGSWWQKPGGTPRAPSGKGKLYEAQRKYRERKKLQKQGKQMDDHPSGPHHQHPKGGGPGSPSAGSQAVSKRQFGRG